MFWTSAAQVAAKLETMRSAEAKLMSFASRFGDRAPGSYNMELFDTAIPHSVVPFKKQPVDAEDLVMHGIRVTNTAPSKTKSSAPLVILHGYMNGALYFYRNLVGLTQYFNTVVSLDLLGWGLSSRPQFRLKDDSVESAQDFFVESLEAWRERNHIEKMVLAGHSMGGYLSVAYCEKYPERVERLVLLSPVGVPERDEEQSNKARANRSLSRRMLFSFFVTMFHWGSNPSSFLRSLPESKSRSWVSYYIENRLPAITQEDEREALTEYLHTNTLLPGSAEYALNQILHADAFAKKPAVHRIPLLKVPHVSFLYGENDWMDSKGGLAVQQAANARHSTGLSSPEVNVFSIKDAGHLLMLDNWMEVNSGILIGGGGRRAVPKQWPLPSIVVQSEDEQVEEKQNELTPRRGVEVQV